MADDTGDAAPSAFPKANAWTIKGMPAAIRQKAVHAAGADGQTVAQFMSEAIELLIAKRAGDVVMPPAPPPALTPDQVTDRIMAVAALQQSMAALKAAKGRASGRDTARLALASLEHQLAEGVGIEPIRIARPSAFVAAPADGDS